MRRITLVLVALALVAAFAVPAGAKVPQQSTVVPDRVPEVEVAQLEADVHAYLDEVARQAALQAYLDSLPRIEVDWARWERLHVCEQGDSWYASGYFGNGLHGSGGLGMSDDAWRMAVGAAAARGVALPASALDASPDQQMIGAQAFYDANGWGWGCHV